MSSSNSINIPLSDFVSISPLYFSVAPIINGVEQEKSKWGYLTSFDDVDAGEWITLAIADLNNDGCVENLGTLNDCLGNLIPTSLDSIGLPPLKARLADFNGDSVVDFIGTGYAPLGDPTSTVLLYYGNGDGTFTQASNTQFPTIYGGFGETIVVADFDNDGDTDIFLPNYTYYSPLAQNYLLQNRGNGTFDEIADAAGVANRNWPINLKTEGSQALDINQDGFLDLYDASHLYINNGNMTFTDRRQNYGLPLHYDEGVKLYDWNNDGNVDLLLLHPENGPSLFQFDGDSFGSTSNVFQSRYYSAAYGTNAEDVDGDGFMDVIMAGGFNPDGSYKSQTLFLKRQNSYIGSDLRSGVTMQSDLSSFADFDRNGTMDVLLESGNNLRYLKNQASDSTSIKVTMFGDGGAKNQHGRLIRAVPQNDPTFIMTRFVDGGSGYRANTEYQVTFPTPKGDSYWISAQYDNGIVGGWAKTGSNVKIYRDGRFIVAPR